MATKRARQSLIAEFFDASSPIVKKPKVAKIEPNSHEDALVRVASDCSGINCPLAALSAAGVRYEELWYSDTCRHAQRVAAANRKTAGARCRVYDDMLQRDHGELPQVDLYVAGPPCQPFSTMGARNGTRDPRFRAFLATIETIATAKPRAFCLENVKLSTVDLRSVTRKLTAELRGSYHLHWRDLNAREFGPQNRDRLYVVGILKTERVRGFAWPQPPRSKLGVRDVLEDDDDLEKSGADLELCTFAPAQRSAIARCREHCGSAFHRTPHLMNYDSSKARMSVLKDTCPAVTTKSRAYVSVTPRCSEGRKLTFLEHARMQGIPDDFDWAGVSRNRRHVLVGNGMCVHLLRHLLVSILDALQW